MEAFIVTALKNFCHSHEIFGESSVYVRFEIDRVDNTINDGFNSSNYFGRIVYRKGDEEQVSPLLMLKTMPRVSLCNKDYSQVQLFNEIFFYTRALPMFQQLGNLQSLLPNLYDSQIHLNGRAEDFVLIFENLRPQGFRTAEPHSFLDFAHLSLMLRKLGNFHAFSYYAEKKNPKEFHALGKWFYSPESIRVKLLPNLFRRRALRGLQPLRQDPHYSNRLENVEKIIENANDFLNQLNNLEFEKPTRMSVLCHGDYIRGNVMFRYENGQPCDLKMIDLAWCKIASPVVDLSTVLYLNADQTTRNLHWDQLIDSYYEGLNEVFDGEGVPSRSDIINEFHTKAMYSYFMASLFLPMSISMDRGMHTYEQLLGEEYSSCSFCSVPERVLNCALDTVGESEGTEALVDVLRDIIDRNFM